MLKDSLQPARFMLLNNYINSQIELGDIVTPLLNEERSIELNNLRIGGERATAKYKGDWIDIHFKHYRESTTNELTLRFYSYDLPELELPVDIKAVDGSEIRKTFYDMFDTYERWIYRG